MAKLQWVSLDEKELWDRLVSEFCNADIYYMHGYAKSFSLVSDGEPQLVYFSANEFSAINVVQKRAIHGTDSYDLTSLYGYGGWIVSGDINDRNLQILFESYFSYCISNNIVSEVIRAHPIACYSELLASWYNKRDVGPIVNIDLTLSDMWADMPSKSRNMIRKAEKQGVLINVGGKEIITPGDFKLIYDETMIRAGASPFYLFSKDFHECFDLLLNKTFNYFTATLDGDVLCTAIITHMNGMMNYHLSGSSSSSRGVPAMNLLINHAINWGHERGFHSLNLGGGVGAKDDNLFKFKQSFTRSSSRQFSLLTKIFDLGAYQSLIDNREQLGGKISDINYFPKYRAHN